MSKFKEGDKIITIKDTPLKPEGWIGYITSADSCFRYHAHENYAAEEYFAFEGHELALLNPSVHIPNGFDRDDITPQEIEGISSSVNKPDAVNSPKHYSVFEQLEAIEVIASSMTTEQFYGYCLGNILKYRLRAGGKDDVMQELGKADKYQELFSKFKPLCQDYV